MKISLNRQMTIDAGKHTDEERGGKGEWNNSIYVNEHESKRHEEMNMKAKGMGKKNRESYWHPPRGISKTIMDLIINNTGKGNKEKRKDGNAGESKRKNKVKVGKNEDQFK